MIYLEKRKTFDEDEVIIVPPSMELHYKKQFLKRNYQFHNLRSFLLKAYEGSNKLVSKEQDFIMMLNAYEAVKTTLKRYKNVNPVTFTKQLLNTYDDFIDYELVENDVVASLEIIYRYYEELLLKSGLFNEHLLIKHVVNNVRLDGKYVFLNVEKLSNEELLLINNMGCNGTVTLSLDNASNVMLDKLKEIGVTTDSSLENDSKSHEKASFALLNDVEEELGYVLNDISKKVMDGFHYHDFIIVTNDLDVYEPYFDLVFDIPYNKKNTTGTLVKRFISLFTKVINGDFSCGAFVNLLKLDLFKIDLEMVDKLDDYVYLWNLENADFYLPFTLNPSGNKKCFSDGDKALLKSLNEAKEGIINPLKCFLENVVNERNVNTILREFFTYLSEEEIDERLFKLDEEGYNNFVNVLDNINDYLVGDFSASFVINVVNALVTPQSNEGLTQDEVVISELSKACFKDKKFVYFIGASEEMLPLKFKINGLLSTTDINKESLIKRVKDYDDYQDYLFYKLLNNKTVTFSAHQLAPDLTLKLPSKLVSKINQVGKLDRLYNKRLIANQLSLLLADDKIQPSDVCINGANKIIKAYQHDLNFRITPDNAKKLYGTNITCSPSSVETYSKCAFYHFCNYGLRLKIKEKYTFDSRAVGTFVHFLLERIIKNEFNTITEANLEEKITKYSLEYLKDNNTIINNTIRYVIKTLGKNVSMLIKNMLKERDVTRFRARYFEFKINNESIIKPVTVPLNEGVLTLTGVVDRVDVYEDDDYYLRVIDYKTGEKKFRLDDCMAGLNLQMVLYLLAINEEAKKITDKHFTPAGILYYPAKVKEAMVTRGLSNEEIGKTVGERIRMDGMINRDERVLKAYGGDFLGDFVNVCSRGKINDEKVFGIDELNLLFENVKDSLKRIGNEILEGKVAVNPVGGRVNACDYCKFASVCGFDKEMDKYRKLKDYKNSEVFKMLEGDLDA